MKPEDDFIKWVGPHRFYKSAGVYELYALVHHCGMKPKHRLLDFGCGSLRLGMYAMQYLVKILRRLVSRVFYFPESGRNSCIQNVGRICKVILSHPFEEFKQFLVKQ